jgi:hypothetical protein
VTRIPSSSSTNKRRVGSDSVVDPPSSRRNGGARFRGTAEDKLVLVSTHAQSSVCPTSIHYCPAGGERLCRLMSAAALIAQNTRPGKVLGERETILFHRTLSQEMDGEAATMAIRLHTPEKEYFYFGTNGGATNLRLRDPSTSSGPEGTQGEPVRHAFGPMVRDCLSQEWAISIFASLLASSVISRFPSCTPIFSRNARGGSPPAKIQT